MQTQQLALPLLMLVMITTINFLCFQIVPQRVWGQRWWMTVWWKGKKWELNEYTEIDFIVTYAGQKGNHWCNSLFEQRSVSHNMAKLHVYLSLIVHPFLYMYIVESVGSLSTLTCICCLSSWAFVIIRFKYKFMFCFLFPLMRTAVLFHFSITANFVQFQEKKTVSFL